MSHADVDRWIETFPFARSLDPGALGRFASALQFPTLSAGQIAYERDWPCPNYLMCIEGRTRVFQTSESGRELLIYNVEAGGTCVLTTQCLLSRTNFPAESVAEAPTRLAAMSADHFYTFMEELPAFRSFVMADYTKLLSSMFSFVDSLAFKSIEQRLAGRLLVEGGETLVVGKTHQQLASDIGSVREIVSRQLGDWERRGWVSNARGQVRILDPAALAQRKAS